MTSSLLSIQREFAHFSALSLPATAARYAFIYAFKVSRSSPPRTFCISERVLPSAPFCVMASAVSTERGETRVFLPDLYSSLKRSSANDAAAFAKRLSGFLDAPLPLVMPCMRSCAAAPLLPLSVAVIEVSPSFVGVTVVSSVVCDVRDVPESGFFTHAARGSMTAAQSRRAANLLSFISFLLFLFMRP